MTRQEHLNWCKQRAMEYVNAGDNAQAFGSLCSDLIRQAGPETQDKQDQRNPPLPPATGYAPGPTVTYVDRLAAASLEDFLRDYGGWNDYTRVAKSQSSSLHTERRRRRRITTN